MTITADLSPYPLGEETRKYLDSIAFGHLIEGELVQSVSGETLPIYEPSTGNEIGRVAAGGTEELERAVCQLCTIYSSHGLIEQKIIAKWLEPISYGFHDVKLFLGTQIYDAGHKVEALRKRALANGGGLGRSPLGTLYRGFYGSLKFSELAVVLDQEDDLRTALFARADLLVEAALRGGTCHVVDLLGRPDRHRSLDHLFLLVSRVVHGRHLRKPSVPRAAARGRTWFGPSGSRPRYGRRAIRPARGRRPGRRLRRAVREGRARGGT